MIAITTKSSISVNPFRTDRLVSDMSINPQ
jgi:hypothetical protein